MDTETTTDRTTTDHHPTPAAPNLDEGSVDASIAATRRVQHLSAVVMTHLDDTDRHTDNPETLAKAVIKALYQIHPHIRLDDALELAHLVKIPPGDVSTRQAIEYVVDDACTHLDAWGRFTTAETATPVSRQRTRV